MEALRRGQTQLQGRLKEEAGVGVAAALARVIRLQNAPLFADLPTEEGKEQPRGAPKDDSSKRVHDLNSTHVSWPCAHEQALICVDQDHF